jgi:hypothetical protein
VIKILSIDWQSRSLFFLSSVTVSSLVGKLAGTKGGDTKPDTAFCIADGEGDGSSKTDKSPTGLITTLFLTPVLGSVSVLGGAGDENGSNSSNWLASKF